MPVVDNEVNAAKCVCPGCPSYNDCLRGESTVLFCAREKSSCEISEQGCICGGCPITAEFGLTNYYYCKR